MTHPATLAFYVSGHGFGHASRQIEILNALGRRVPGLSLLVRTAAPRWLFDRTLRVPATLIPGECDTGAVQIDSLRLDEAATVRAAREFYARFDERVAEEAALLRAKRVALVVSDAPPVACAAAAAVDIPSIVIGNFTWDWIYAGYSDRFGAEIADTVGIIGEAYARAIAGWRLPLHGGFETLRKVVDLPFVARHARRPPDEVRELLGLPARPLVLSSFGGYGLPGLNLESLDIFERWTVVVTGTTEPAARGTGIVYVNEREMYARGLRYEDLVGAVDVVATKPGYGIISECAANGTAVLYTSRGRFREYDAMVREMPRVVRCAHIEQASLFTGAWREPLDALLASPAPERVPTNGAELAAERLSAVLDGGGPHDADPR